MRKLLASTAICGLLATSGCIQTPTEGQKDAQTAYQAPPAPTVTTTVTHRATATTPTTTQTYSRDQFGSGWGDPDHNGCDARQDAVRRATIRVITRTSACQIRVADLRDVYSGRTYPAATTSGFDVDHVVALADAWRSGANKWTRARRVAYANDPAVLVLTTASANRSKSDQGPDQWAPTNHDGACWYARRYQQIKRLWRLHTTRTQRTAIRNTLKDCP